MKHLLFTLSLTSCLLFSVHFAHAEVTEVDGIDEDIERTEMSSACALRVKSPGYNIRRNPTARGREKRRGVCGGTLRSSDMSAHVAPIGVVGNWIKINHPSCPNETAYVYFKAFEYSDVQAFRSGQCRMALNYGYRNPPPAPAPQKTTQVTGTTSHQFVMDRCQGIRNDKYGSGHYGARRGGGRRTHAGCDYRAAVGTPLKSPCNGRVVAAGYGRVSGNLLTIQCDNGDKFRMMHLQNRSMVKSGTRVGPGSYVGKVGKTGNANVRNMIPHLHIEAFVQGRRVDPQRLWNCR